MCAFYIDEEVKDKAKEKLKNLFGSYKEEEIKDINEKIGS